MRCIYAICHTESGRRYVGSVVDFYRRKVRHLSERSVRRFQLIKKCTTTDACTKTFKRNENQDEQSGHEKEKLTGFYPVGRNRGKDK